MPDCIFCKIINRELPCFKLSEDEHTLSFLDIRPVHKGHALAISKKHYADLLDTDPEALAYVTRTAQKVARAIVKGVGADGCNVTTNNGAAAGQVIFHLHWHIIPRFEGDGLKLWPQGSYADGEAEQIKNVIVSSLS